MYSRTKRVYANPPEGEEYPTLTSQNSTSILIKHFCNGLPVLSNEKGLELISIIEENNHEDGFKIIFQAVRYFFSINGTGIY